MAVEMAPDDRLTLEQQICFSLAVASRDVVSLYRPFLEPLGLTHPQYLLMVTLWERSRGWLAEPWWAASAGSARTGSAPGSVALVHGVDRGGDRW